MPQHLQRERTGPMDDDDAHLPVNDGSEDERWESSHGGRGYNSGKTEVCRIIYYHALGDLRLMRYIWQFKVPQFLPVILRM